MFKYQVRSISELYDKCTPEEWAELMYVADINLHKHLNIALEMYIKELLTLQRHNRWSWFVKYAQDLPEEINEIKQILNLNKIDFEMFANDVYFLFNMVDPKMNCLRLIGVPNSGKTLLAQLLCQPFISAYVNNHNSENEFYLSSFLNKAVCLCEELMITPATAEDFKSILGGQPIEISKKYTTKQTLIRTPIIVTSNHDKFGRGHLAPLDEVALSLRCMTHRFSTQYKPKVQVTLPALSYFVFDYCSITNKISVCP